VRRTEDASHGENQIHRGIAGRQRLVDARLYSPQKLRETSIQVHPFT